MPKRQNTKKAAAAAFGNAKAIMQVKKNGGLFGAVTKRLGNGGFQVVVSTDSDMATLMATPRGLFTSGSMRISVGHVVILEGQIRAKGDQRAPLPLEIVGLLNKKAEILEIIDEGHMSASVLRAAETAGMLEAGQQEGQGDDIEFEEEGAVGMVEMREVKGGIKGQRKAEENAASIAARAACLMGASLAAAEGKKVKGKGLDGCLLEGDAADPTLLTGLNEEFRRWRAKVTAKKTAMAVGGCSAAPAVQAAKVQTEDEIWAEIEAQEVAKETAAIQAEALSRLRTIAHAEEVKAFLASRVVRDNWDDEVDINDL